jgi:hypothetical protein
VASAGLQDLGFLTDAYTKLDGKPRLQLDTGEGNKDCILVFYTEHGQESLALSFYWLGDGNHGVTPNSALHVYIILAGLDHEKNRTLFLPAVYAFMTSKNKKRYKKLFEKPWHSCQSSLMSKRCS